MGKGLTVRCGTALVGLLCASIPETWGFKVRPRGLGLIVLSALLAGCAGQIAFTSGPYRGRVIDGQTRQPLAGAAVVAVWYWEGWGPGHPSERLHDALEVVTGPDGEFVLPQKTHFALTGGVNEPYIVIYYPGYKDFLGGRPTESERAAGEPKLVELVRASNSERPRYAGLPTQAGGVPYAKIPNLIRLVNQERRALGLQPVYVEE